MAWASGEVVNVLVFLLPGFVAASVFHSLTSHPKPGIFDRLIQALVFTVVVHAIIVGISLAANTILAANITLEEIWIPVLAVSISVMLALMTVYWSNNDTMHGILRRIGITKETSYPSEWYSTFWRLNDCYVVLHLKGERRLYGWPEEWPSQPDRGHFRISESQWLSEDPKEQTKQPVENDENDGVSATGVSAILIPANDVEMVEFIKSVDGRSQGASHG